MDAATTPRVPIGLVEHASIDKAFRALLAVIDHPGTGDVVPLFETLAERLRAHLAGEELDIARFADVDSADARMLLEQHAAFRATLDVLSGKARAGALSSREIHDFRLRLSLHEAHEETGLYRWVKTH